jgi:hypothetical protein
LTRPSNRGFNIAAAFLKWDAGQTNRMRNMATKNTFQIERLLSGGLITNYFCTSRCRHCLYNCSPRWPKIFITRETVRRNFQKIQSQGCRAVHIGGGEPLLRPESLAEVLEEAARLGMHIDYVETNSAWYRDADSAAEILSRLKKHGLHTLLISISPFHNEHIPFARVEGVIAAARRTGVRRFPWVEGFIADLKRFDPRQPHRLDEFEAQFGRDYLTQILRRYWIHLGGRALTAFRRVLHPHPVEQVLSDSCAAELSDTSHFHMDLFGSYIPGLCAGLTIRGEDLGTPLREQDYPVLQRLYTQGVRGLYQWALANFGFQPQRSGYLNKCDLCTEIRTYLAKNADETFNELKPLEFYHESAHS